MTAIGKLRDSMNDGHRDPIVILIDASKLRRGDLIVAYEMFDCTHVLDGVEPRVITRIRTVAALGKVSLCIGFGPQPWRELHTDTPVLVETMAGSYARMAGR